jgi:hypothetical protein
MDSFNLRFIPIFGDKKQFFDRYESLPDLQKKNYENERLEFIFDTFPCKIEDLENKGGYWRKYESDNRSYYFLSRNPDYVDKELYFNIMNGIMPDPFKTKIEYDAIDHDKKKQISADGQSN